MTRMVLDVESNPGANEPGQFHKSARNPTKIIHSHRQSDINLYFDTHWLIFNIKLLCRDDQTISSVHGQIRGDVRDNTTHA